jgi:hypothetical protein
MKQGKGAVRSLGIWGSVTAIGGMFGLFQDLLAIWNSVDPEQIKAIIEEGKALYYGAVALFGTIMALIGRLRAHEKITGLLKG